jgi:UDP-N-acetylmuramate--alanine ligase
MLANARTNVAVAGSHGKSTTSGMLVSALQALGADPSYAVGAIVGTSGVNAAPGSGPAMVVEADEYDYSFLTLTPDVAIITNVDYDHPDIFPDQETYDSAFVQFASGIRPGGTLVVAGDDPGVGRIIARLRDLPGVALQTFGERESVDWRLTSDSSRSTVVSPASDVISLDLQVPGRHNARNATAAIAALVALGQSALDAAAAVATFTGVGRRFDYKGEAAGVVVVDDYAHHPTEIRAVLRAAHDRYPDRRIVAAFQPHTFSRTKALMQEFASSFADADVPVILEIYPSRETDDLGISSADLIAAMPSGAVAGGTPVHAVDLLTELARPNDLMLTIGAGDITGVGPKVLERLRSRNGTNRE